MQGALERHAIITWYSRFATAAKRWMQCGMSIICCELAFYQDGQHNEPFSLQKKKKYSSHVGRFKVSHLA